MLRRNYKKPSLHILVKIFSIKVVKYQTQQANYPGTLYYHNTRPTIKIMFKIPFLYLAAKVESVFRSPQMRQFAGKYPGLFKFIRNRFKSGVFFGLPFTILLVLTSINLIMLSELAEHVVNSENMKTLDMEVSGWFFNLRNPVLSKGLYYFTQLGSFYGVTAGTTLAGLYLLIKKRGFQLLALLISVLGSSISMHYSKIYFHRERPLNIAYYTTENSFSFPSGHSTSAMALVGILCYFFLIDIKNRTLSILLFTLGVLYILLIGISRIYLGVHFLTDVAAGYLLGFLWVLVAIGLMEYSAISRVKHKME